MLKDFVNLVVSGSLQIKESQETDQGNYECVAENSIGTVYSYAAKLFVRGIILHFPIKKFAVFGSHPPSFCVIPMLQQHHLQTIKHFKTNYFLFIPQCAEYLPGSPSRPKRSTPSWLDPTSTSLAWPMAGMPTTKICQTYGIAPFLKPKPLKNISSVFLRFLPFWECLPENWRTAKLKKKGRFAI